MTQQEIRDKILRAIPKGSIGRYDLLPVFMDAALLSEMAIYFSGFYAGKVDYVASPEAIGWVLGAVIARELGVGFVPIRKGGRLPYRPEDVVSVKYVDYSKAEKLLELKKGSLESGSRVLVVDEWIETGSTVRCCMELLEKQGCTVKGLATIGIDCNKNTGQWIDSRFVSFVGMDM